jgi:cell division protein FtsB
MADHGIGRKVGALLLALVNATLVLVAICLWLAWGALSSAERVAAQVGEAAETVLPLRAEIVTLTGEIAATRAALAALSTEGAGDRAALERRIAGVEAELARLTAAVTALGADPEALIDRAVTSAFERLGATVAEILSGLRRDGAESDS